MDCLHDAFLISPSFHPDAIISCEVGYNYMYIYCVLYDARLDE